MEYWHIQMQYPYGPEDGTEINPRDMLRLPRPLIGTGEWDNIQCRNFKEIPDGSIVLVRRGMEAIALCEVIGPSFKDAELSDQFCHANFRPVKILAWAAQYHQPRAGLFSQGTFKRCINPQTEQYKYIDGWIKNIKKTMIADKCLRLLKSKRNIILQGAPGTGKTYTTAIIALKILGVKDVDFSDHKAVMKRYDSLLDRQIFFTTFHQSMDYEDFVEGLKPRVQSDADGNSTGVTYEPEDGIFKRACSAAIFDEDKDIVEYIDEFKEKIKGIENKRVIPTMSGKSSLYVWWNEGNTTISTRSVNSNSAKDDDYSPSPLNLEKIKRQATGTGRENNWPQYAEAFINAVRKEYEMAKEKPVVLIIDEINRGNISKIFGELITLLEADKREKGDHPIKVTLPYSKALFSVPSNLYIIGTMNTTDRSTGTIDYALRRRFAFVTLKASPEVIEDFYSFDPALGKKAVALFNNIRDFINNPAHINGDYNIDDLMVGHSYFMAKDEDALKDKMEFEVLPLVAEYINDGILNVKPETREKYFSSWLLLNPYKEAPESVPDEDTI